MTSKTGLRQKVKAGIMSPVEALASLDDFARTHKPQLISWLKFTAPERYNKALGGIGTGYINIKIKAIGTYYRLRNKNAIKKAVENEFTPLIQELREHGFITGLNHVDVKNHSLMVLAQESVFDKIKPTLEERGYKVIVIENVETKTEEQKEESSQSGGEKSRKHTVSKKEKRARRRKAEAKKD